MPFWMRQLIARGYWEEASDGVGAGGAGGTAEQSKQESSESAAETKEPEKKAEAQEPPKTTDSEAKLLKEVMKRKEREKELEAKLKQFEGVDINEVKKMLEEKELRKVKELEEKGQWEALKSQMVEASTKAIKEKEDRIVELMAHIEQSNKIVEKLTIDANFSSAKFISEETTLSPTKAKKIYGEYFEIENGSVVAYNKPAGESGRAPLIDGNGDNLSFNEAIAKIIESDPDKETILKSKIKNGSNSGQPGTKAEQVKAPVKLSGIDKIAAGLGNSK